MAAACYPVGPPPSLDFTFPTVEYLPVLPSPGFGAPAHRGFHSGCTSCMLFRCLRSCPVSLIPAFHLLSQRLPVCLPLCTDLHQLERSLLQDHCAKKEPVLCSNTGQEACAWRKASLCARLCATNSVALHDYAAACWTEASVGPAQADAAGVSAELLAAQRVHATQQVSGHGDLGTKLGVDAGKGIEWAVLAVSHGNVAERPQSLKRLHAGRR